MCLALLALDAIPGWPLILLANRDERHGRPAHPLDWWPDRPDVVGGRDGRAGGTWLAARRDGRCATVLNDARVAAPGGAPSRGLLVPRCLDAADTATIVGELHRGRGRFAGFHLLLAEPGAGWYLGSHAEQPRPLPAGIHGVGNGGLEPGGARLRRARLLFDESVSEGVSTEALLACLADTAEPGGGENDCRPVFVADPEFGTRCSTVLAIAGDGRALVHERRYRPDGRADGDSLRKWHLEPRPGTR